jgi:hypothetical protein
MSGSGREIITEPFAVSTAVIVGALLDPLWVVENDAVAVVPR